MGDDEENVYLNIVMPELNLSDKHFEKLAEEYKSAASNILLKVTDGKLYLMNNHFQKIILNAAKAKDIDYIDTIQELWSGYGKIQRIYLTGSSINSVVVKQAHHFAAVL